MSRVRTVTASAAPTGKSRFGEKRFRVRRASPLSGDPSSGWGEAESGDARRTLKSPTRSFELGPRVDLHVLDTVDRNAEHWPALRQVALQRITPVAHLNASTV